MLISASLPVSMSANSNEGPGLDGKWFGEEKNGMFGSAGPRFDEMRDELHAKDWDRETNAPEQQFHSFEGSGVAMETASTGNSVFYFALCVFAARAACYRRR